MRPLPTNDIVIVKGGTDRIGEEATQTQQNLNQGTGSEEKRIREERNTNPKRDDRELRETAETEETCGHAAWRKMKEIWPNRARAGPSDSFETLETSPPFCALLLIVPEIVTPLPASVKKELWDG